MSWNLILPYRRTPPSLLWPRGNLLAQIPGFPWPLLRSNTNDGQGVPPMLSISDNDDEIIQSSIDTQIHTTEETNESEVSTNCENNDALEILESSSQSNDVNIQCQEQNQSTTESIDVGVDVHKSSIHCTGESTEVTDQLNVLDVNTEFSTQNTPSDSEEPKEPTPSAESEESEEPKESTISVDPKESIQSLGSEESEESNLSVEPKKIEEPKESTLSVEPKESEEPKESTPLMGSGESDDRKELHPTEEVSDELLKSWVVDETKQSPEPQQSVMKNDESFIMIDKDDLVFPSTTEEIKPVSKSEKIDSDIGFTKSQLSKKTVPQLKTLCNKYQLPTSGNKPDLIERLLQWQPIDNDSQSL